MESDPSLIDQIGYLVIVLFEVSKYQVQMLEGVLYIIARFYLVYVIKSTEYKYLVRCVFGQKELTGCKMGCLAVLSSSWGPPGAISDMILISTQ